MISSKDKHPRSWRTAVGAAAIVVTATLASTSAYAGGCVTDKVGPNDLVDRATMPSGVTDEVLASIDLSKETVKLDNRLFRIRRLEIQPGGVVPFHEHADRPALIYIVEGTVTEYSSNCTVPIVHKAGEAAMESVGLSHWWKNTGDSVAVLLSADLLHVQKDDEKMM